MSERRVDKRYPIQVRVWCEGDDFTVLVETQNVSRMGMFIRTSNPPPRGKCFKMVIEELGTVANVEVKWVRDKSQNIRPGMGVQILDFEQGGHAFERFLEQNTSRSGEHSFAKDVLS